MELTSKEKLYLLNTARNAIKSLFKDISIETPDYSDYPVFNEKAGAFVTLTKGHRLRGCIGYILSDRPLFETVVDAAKQSAWGDPRFPNLNEEEIDEVAVEISVLSPPFKMKSYDEIVLGKHGLIVNEGGRRGLLLPQVPVEHNLDKEQFLTALCEKAGLPDHYWKEKTLDIDMFTANVFSEKESEVKNE